MRKPTRQRDGLMTGAEVAAYLRVSPALWYGRICREVPFVLVGSRRRYRLADVDRWLDEQTTKGAHNGAA